MPEQKVSRKELLESLQTIKPALSDNAIVPVLLLELACRTGLVPPLTMPPPSAWAMGLFDILQSGRMNAAKLSQTSASVYSRSLSRTL